jgi:DNA-binding XRE family transcriptional regulator
VTHPALTAPLWKHAEGRHVYFIQGIDGGPIKIGSGNDPEKRLRQFQSASPVILRLLGVIWDAGAWHERDLHREFADLRSHGEWFQPAPRLLAYIAQHAGRPVQPIPRTNAGGPVDGLKLAALRRQAKLSRTQLARLARVDYATLSRFEHGQQDNPRLNTLLAIARALQCRVIDFAPILGEVQGQPKEAAS